MSVGYESCLAHFPIDSIQGGQRLSNSGLANLLVPREMNEVRAASGTVVVFSAHARVPGALSCSKENLQREITTFYVIFSYYNLYIYSANDIFLQ